MPLPVRRDIRSFDPSRQLVMARAATLFHFDVKAGDPLTIVEGPIDEDSAKGEITAENAVRMWLSGQADYLDEQKIGIPWPEKADVQMTEVGSGWYRITAPWLTETVTVRGEEDAKAKRQEIEDRGDTKGVEITDLGGGWYSVSAPWLDEPHKEQGKDAAQALYESVIQSGPPEGWVFMTPDEKEQARQLAEQQLRDQEEIARIREEAEAEAERGRIADQNAIQAAAWRAGLKEGDWVITIDTDDDKAGPITAINGDDITFQPEGGEPVTRKAADLQPALAPHPAGQSLTAADGADTLVADGAAPTGDSTDVRPATSEGSTDIQAQDAAGNSDAGNKSGTPEGEAEALEETELEARNQTAAEEGGAVRGTGEGAADQETASDTQFKVEPSAGGWFTISGPGIDPIKVRGQQAVDDKLAELKAG